MTDEIKGGGSISLPSEVASSGEEADSEDQEMNAILTMMKTLKPLQQESQIRAIRYVAERLGAGIPKPIKIANATTAVEAVEEEDAAEGRFSSFAELFDATSPQTLPEKALVGGYWLQVCEGEEAFDGFSVNRECKNLGHPITNITYALEALKAQRPALVLQLKKSGKARQARKTYKLSGAGIRQVESMING